MNTKFKKQPIDEGIEKRDDLYYLSGTDTLFTGTFQDYWDSGDPKGFYEIKDGKLHGT